MDDQDQHMHENLQPNFSYSNNLNESIGDFNTNIAKEEEGEYKGELVKKNQIQENQNGSGKMIDICKGRIENSCECNRKSHILTEKERRKRMRNLFDELRAFVPNLPSTASKLTIVDEAMNYMKSLEHTVDKLEKLKQERLKSVSTFGCDLFVNKSKEKLIVNQVSSSNLACGKATSNPSNSNLPSFPQHHVSFQTWYSPNVVLNICGDVASFCVYTPRKANLLTNITLVLDKYNIELITGNVFCNDDGYFKCMILAKANVVSSHQFIEKTYLDEIYKQAAEAIKLLIS